MANKFISELDLASDELLIGLHVGAGKPANRWSLIKYSSLISKLNDTFSVKFYLTGSNSDNEELNFVKENVSFALPVFQNRKIPEVAALISLSDLFIGNDTGIMHVAGTTVTPQITIFGPTNPFNWAPIGENKYFIRKSEFIDDVSVDDVFDLCNDVLEKNRKVLKIAE